MPYTRTRTRTRTRTCTRTRTFFDCKMVLSLFLFPLSFSFLSPAKGLATFEWTYDKDSRGNQCTPDTETGTSRNISL